MSAWLFVCQIPDIIFLALIGLDFTQSNYLSLLFGFCCFCRRCYDSVETASFLVALEVCYKEIEWQSFTQDNLSTSEFWQAFSELCKFSICILDCLLKSKYCITHWLCWSQLIWIRGTGDVCLSCCMLLKSNYIQFIRLFPFFLGTCL